MSGNSSSENWIEFIKCLELFTQDSMSKENFLDSVEDLFRPAHMDLFDEFKKLIDQRSEYDAHQHDLWYAVPLSEIDFSQCRKCTPSYRALPRDYPKSKCTERSKEEQNVLNDQWVSIPIGSEESYSFKHMRKNQYEEALFKCEDERFEIDMIIDSNMSTIRMLEPLAEEIQSIKRIDEKSNRDGATPKILTPRFSLHLEKRQLSTIHLNAITRIYGDHGEEILELLRKNPAGTIPVILKRLKQKDLEWRKARKELNKHWSEVVEKNFHKSFDHRSFYFRQQDKKYLSTRQFVSDLALPLNTVVANAAATVPTAAIASSGASTVSCSVVPPPPIEVSDPSGARDSDSSGPAPGVSYNIAKELEPYLAGMKPNLVLDYDNDAHLIHRDIYRIMCHAAEHTLSSSSDKERLAALWRDLLRVSTILSSS